MMADLVVVENEKLDFGAIKATLQLEKKIVVAEVSATPNSIGHFCDYFNPSRVLVALCAKKDRRIMLWNSQLLVGNCINNSALQVNFKLMPADLSQRIEVQKLETWCVSNRFILRKSKDGLDLTYHFNLLDSHLITGELIVAPLIYFVANPVFTVNSEEPSALNELFKIKPIILEVKENQVLCFDKYHYQFAYNSDFYFIRVNDADRAN